MALRWHSYSDIFTDSGCYAYLLSSDKDHPRFSIIIRGFVGAATNEQNILVYTSENKFDVTVAGYKLPSFYSTLTGAKMAGLAFAIDLLVKRDDLVSKELLEMLCSEEVY